MNLRQKAPNVPSHWDMPEPPHRTMPGELVSISVNSWLSQNPSKTIPKSVRFHERKSEINDPDKSGRFQNSPFTINTTTATYKSGPTHSSG